MSKRKYTKEFLEPLVKEANSVRDLLRKINVTDSGGSHKLISKRIKEFEINTNHFKGGPRVPHNKLSSDDILVEDWEIVKAWQLIGYTWNTWNSTWPHLHFSFRRIDSRWNPIDAKNWFKGREDIYWKGWINQHLPSKY